MDKNLFMKKDINTYREIIKKRLSNHSKQFLVAVGPCSISSEEDAIAYDLLLSELQKKLGEEILLVMRAFVEKSRTANSWKGFVYQPNFNKNENIIEGISRTKELFSKLNSPLAMEFINPSIYPLLSPYISWGFIGARTSSSLTHRMIASESSLPFGIKNSLDGNIISAINGCLFAKESHCKLNGDSQIYTKGNPYTHIVLRGGTHHPNYDQSSTSNAYELLEKNQIPHPILIDCSHGNCRNKPFDQEYVFKNVVRQYINNPNKILGAMVESNLNEGKGEKENKMGLSITDPCIGFKHTEDLLLWAKEEITAGYKEELYQPTSYECNH